MLFNIILENCYAIEHIHISSDQSKSFRRRDLLVFNIRFDVVVVVDDDDDDDGDDIELINK